MGLFSKFKKDGREIYLLCGLGNYGEKYENTRHNTGFITIDRIADKLGVRINKIKHYSMMGETDFEGRRLLLMKPQTYMNNSGRAVADCVRYYKIPPEHIIVVSDDCNLGAGVLRIRASGSAGGHNGLKSIISFLGSENFVRMRIGIGVKPSAEADLADWVLSKFTATEKDKLMDAADRVLGALPLVMDGDIQAAMGSFNG